MQIFIYCKVTLHVSESQHSSSGVLKTVTAASGTGHNTGKATSLQRGLNRPRWREVAIPILLPVPEAPVTVLWNLDDGCCDSETCRVTLQ